MKSGGLDPNERELIEASDREKNISSFAARANHAVNASTRDINAAVLAARHCDKFRGNLAPRWNYLLCQKASAS